MRGDAERLHFPGEQRGHFGKPYAPGGDARLAAEAGEQGNALLGPSVDLRVDVLHGFLPGVCQAPTLRPCSGSGGAARTGQFVREVSKNIIPTIGTMRRRDIWSSAASPHPKAILRWAKR